MGPLSSQTKCNTSLRRCCHGAEVRAAFSGRSMRDCPAFGRWQPDPANRGSSGSLAINNLSGAEAQHGCSGWLQAFLCQSTGTSTALGGLSPRTGARPAPCGDGTARKRLVAGTDRRPPGPRTRAQGDLLREHLSLHLRPNGPHQELQLAPLSAAQEEQTGLSRQQAQQSCKLHRRPCFIGKTTDRGRRSQDRRPLGSRPHDVLKIRSSRPDRARTHVSRLTGHPPCQ